MNKELIHQTGERAADMVDEATILGIAETDTFLQKKKVAQACLKLDPDFDGVHCVGSCGEAIEPGRIKSLTFEVVDDGSHHIRRHPTDKIEFRDGQKIIIKHGTDKCIACKQEFDFNITRMTAGRR